MEFPDFAWACGEEASDPKVLHAGEEVRVDLLLRSRHLLHQHRDLHDVARLGLRVYRYGMPWRLCEPAPGEYDWTLWDRALETCREYDLLPVVDLCHFGLPDHLGGFCDPEWVGAFRRYVEAFCERYPEPRWFTPVNEPLITAFYSGFRGYWNDRRTSLEDFATALCNCLLANAEAMALLRADRDAVEVGAEGIFLPLVADGHEQGADEAAWFSALGRTTWDLRFGHPLDPLMAPAFERVDDGVRSRLAELVTTERTIAGHDVYPICVKTFGLDRMTLSVAEHLDVYVPFARAWHQRYGVPFWVAETSNFGLPVTAQEPWLDGLVDRLRLLRGEGVGVRGLCWYSRGDQYDWESRLTEPVGRVTQVGLFDTQRRPRPVAENLRRLVAAGI
jgi:hypothetical protein